MDQITAFSNSVKSSVYNMSIAYSVGLGGGVLLQQGVKFWSKSQNYPALQALVSSPNFLQRIALCLAVQACVKRHLDNCFPDIHKYEVIKKGQTVLVPNKSPLELLAARLGKNYVSSISTVALGFFVATTVNTNSRTYTFVKYTLWAASAITLSRYFEEATGSKYGLYAGAKKLGIA